jgi:putative DNA primase/helicase
LTPPTLCLSGAAKRDWISYHDDVEGELGGSGDFGNVQDFAAKTAENAARIAALLHIFEHGPGGEISQNLMQAGAALASWHLFEAKRIIGATEAPQIDFRCPPAARLDHRTGSEDDNPQTYSAIRP